jgi:tetratricopeptide (TPR) repeat protein
MSRPGHVPEIGHRQGEASARNFLGHAFRAVGRPAIAVGHYQAALVMYRDIGERAYEIEVINGLAAAQADMGDLDAARDTYTTALNAAEQTGDRHEQAAAHRGLAALYAAGGDTRLAERHRRAAHVIHADLGLPAADTPAS